MKKKLLLLTTVAILLFGCFEQNVYAVSNAMQIDNQVRFSNFTRFENRFSISKSGKATLSSVVIARNVDEIKINLYLQRYSDGAWRTVRSWSEIESGTSFVVEKDYYVTSGYAYRMVSYAYVYDGGELLESSSSTSELTTY